MKGLAHFAALAASVGAARAAVSVTVGSQPRQTLTAFGASGAWWPNDLIHFPEKTQSDLANFLFSEDGIYLSSYRYNMGGDGGNDTQQVTSWGSRVESFLLRNGTYDWGRDHAGVKFLEFASQYHVPYITFFINAAPSNVSGNGASCGWNFTANKDEPFAKYIETVLTHWTEQGINISYISPMNEPDNNRADCGQEGMLVAPDLRAGVFEAIRAALNGSPSDYVGIIGDETSRPYLQGISENPIWLPESKSSLVAVAVHDYDYVTDAQLEEYYQQVVSLTSPHPLPIKFTEICCSTTAGNGPSVFGAQYDPTMTNALIVARYVWQFLTIAQSPSFDWWTAATTLPCSPTVDGEQCATAINETAGYNSGLVYYDGNYNETGNYNIYYTKRAFMMKQFAYFHRPGSVRYDVPESQLPFGVTAIASKSGEGNGKGKDRGEETWAILFMNNQTTTIEISLAPPEKGLKLARIVETTNEIDFGDATLPPSMPASGEVEWVLPAQSMVTFQFVRSNGKGGHGWENKRAWSTNTGNALS